ncbi:uncharacterized protein NECHADRAFT_87264 [Fusarium vanettenii 77-13-4]|uniref:Transcription factor domain-containing protein n=1 Tax=Fusarium vanettenii (strain ATCC MYA-4622 / CBS 123669 / FGSC 9596 / NRRL 45880 / 77-13-4) TaxID=660122 RepID=C7ZIU2_FUSV7|nr:uncharacterized protein NECHADRAFT_87264 [Fusarium vanettenii 77-13-4]EEU36144.1 predicted protein [Fusarium vanettenii 77-13-4]
MQAERAGPLMSGPTVVLQKRGRGRRPKGAKGHVLSRQERSHTGMIQFINATLHNGLGDTSNIKLIRSHAAKHSRALRRETKQQQHSAPTTTSVEDTASERIPDEEEAEEPYVSLNENHKRMSQLGIGSRARHRRLAPKPQTTALQRRTRSRSPSPIQLVGGARKDAFQTFARSMSEDEQYLFDFSYPQDINYVIEYGYKACYHKEDEKVFQASMRDVWVPWAMGQPSLMAAIFHVACRNYAATTNNSNSKKYAVKKLQYRLTCLEMAKEAISSQDVATDTTIALALLMASESVRALFLLLKAVLTPDCSTLKETWMRSLPTA